MGRRRKNSSGRDLLLGAALTAGAYAAYKVSQWNRPVPEDTTALEFYHEELLKAQQAELDSALMYNVLADLVTDPDTAEKLRGFAKDEADHATIYYHLTRTELTARDTRSTAICTGYRLLGRAGTFGTLATAEYTAAKACEHLCRHFPEIEMIRDDEIRHGDELLAMLKQ
ncbi:MAG: hypothetical protein IJI33_09305 [Solobacterium sp.]|nr:hypothetical protein [Solobacterium sp.]